MCPYRARASPLLGIADFLAYTTFMGKRFMRDGKTQPAANWRRP
jgi:hypothetical protein